MNFVNSDGHKADFLGRSDSRGQYHSGPYGLNSEVKHAERVKTMDFILSHFTNGDNKLKLLSFPGIDWSFERMILIARPGSQFVGLEHSYTEFVKSSRMIPGAKGRNVSMVEMGERIRGFGEGSYVYSRRTRAPGSKVAGNRANRLLCMKSDTYATMLTTDYGASFSQKEEFHSRFCKRNAFWLDFTSQICKSVRDTISNLHICASADDVPKPVVVTLMSARDGISGVDRRVEEVLSCQPLLNYERHWTYAGKNNVPMLTICGSIT